MADNNTSGRVLSSCGGFYQVVSAQGSFECRLRGKLKHTGAFFDATDGVCVGDFVQISLHMQENEMTGMIEAILPRTNILPRPRIANAQLCVAVMAAREPVYDLLLLDKILLSATYYGLETAVCFNKCDLAEDDLPPLMQVYCQAGFNSLQTSALHGQGIDGLRHLLENKISVLAGPSGVGKSSLLKALLPEYNTTVGEISARLQRGQHTTRHVNLLPLATGGLVADTPGFSLLDLPPALKAANLTELYPKYADIAAGCRFLGCLHHHEPDCAIKEHVAAGKLDSGRYQRYLRLLSEMP